MLRRLRRGRGGLTLLKALLTAGILTILGMFLASGVAYGRGLARDAACHGHLRRLWLATMEYAKCHDGAFFVNHTTPLHISNIIFADSRPTGWGQLHPRYLGNYHTFFCPDDAGRGPAWEYGWSNWGAGSSQVQCSYGYRGRHGFGVSDGTGLTLAMIERDPGRVLGCDFYEPFFDPPRVHHSTHINVLRCNGRVEDVDKIVSFGPHADDLDFALTVLDR